MTVRLDERPARADLTSREVAKILGGSIGVLLQMAKVADVRAAVRWWAQTDACWEAGQAMLKDIAAEIQKR